jgi:hypothetical protein
MREKPTNAPITLVNTQNVSVTKIVDSTSIQCAESKYGLRSKLMALVVMIATHNVTRHNTPIHNILSTAPQLRISQNALGTFPEESNVMPKHVHN